MTFITCSEVAGEAEARPRRVAGQIDERLLTLAEGRRVLTELDPLLFALVYLPHHLRGPETGDAISFSGAHFEWCELAQRYIRPINTFEHGDLRDAIIAPRGLGKSTWWFLIFPMWMASHGHRSFLAAFANCDTQATDHSGTFKREIVTNALLRYDFPKLCAPARRPTGVSISDSQRMCIAESGFVFTGRGIDSQVLGLKIGSRRPDHIILDDIEGTKGNYSANQKVSRLKTLVSGILPMNNKAPVMMAGTVAIPGAIVDDIAAKQRGEQYPAWVDDERFTPRYFDVIQTDERGNERSLWPERWSMDWISTVRHTRQFQIRCATTRWPLTPPSGSVRTSWSAPAWRSRTSWKIRRGLMGMWRMGAACFGI
ncbi:hypothetical protein [Amycolatopsis sp. Hca4]|uniref:hypothetical protein n=1 Tax=Amycolatopsis sp. Hca4 TaxID=2742131 RepID=UPI001592A2D9|nr:hypothetical protein [Amycolatopsis sp. Hca4]QKV74180.1 hypothetical protein HUT10_10690 [Amycolatopsis sp. Hca4]